MKKIVLLSDGTGNSAAKQHKTNVWRLYQALDLHRDDQIAFYDDGVGTHNFLPLKLLGSAFGWGLKRNVLDLYEFLCSNYEDGDKIYLFGFSRGAFTVRLLAGMIRSQGLYVPKPTTDLRRIARKLFNAYRVSGSRGWLTWPFLWWRSRGAPSGSQPPEIEFIGVWDTVEAYGFPIDELSKFWDRLIYPLRFGNQTLPCNVKRACQALAVDEERLSFYPVLWDEAPHDTRGTNAARRALATVCKFLRKLLFPVPKGDSKVTKKGAGEGKYTGIEQVWFPGVHADVGGGYAMSNLSLVPLDWMISKVERSLARPDGLRFFSSSRDQYLRRCDWHAKQHDSRSGLAAYYRYKPRDIRRICKDRKIATPKLHRSVLERTQQGVVPYSPTSPPRTYKVVSTRGKMKWKSQYETDPESTRRAKAMDAALDVVFWRRWLHFAFVLSTVFAVAAGVSEPNRWLDLSWQNPWWVGAAVVGGLLAWLKWLASRTTLKHAGAAWSYLKRRERPIVYHKRFLPTTRLRALLQWDPLRGLVKWSLSTTLFVVAIFAFLSIVSRSTFSVRASLDDLCVPTREYTLRGEGSIPFDIANPCQATGIKLEEGTLYHFKVKQQEGLWKDGRRRAGPSGYTSAGMLLAAINRRHLSEPWLKLMGRVGPSGRETFAIGSWPTLYRARSDGELFLYVNDGVLGLPWWGDWWAWPYDWPIGRNKGKARVTVSTVREGKRLNEL